MKLLFSDHERYKLEKKRERNRIAATKCRMRKMERISQLDGQVNLDIFKIKQLREQTVSLLSSYTRVSLVHLKFPVLKI